MTMPLNNRDYIHLGLLICCLPLQYYLSNFSSLKLKNNELTNSIISDLRYVTVFLKQWFNPLIDIFSWLFTSILDVLEGADESPAVEVFEYRRKNGGDKVKLSETHSTRPDGLRFRIGQVVEHVYEGYRGVIIEWQHDPESLKNPLYKILIDDNYITDEDELDSEVAVQDELSLLSNTQISNKSLKNYFVAFDGTQYIPQPWLRQLYPKD